jgi:hypothetical protein
MDDTAKIAAATNRDAPAVIVDPPLHIAGLP